MAKTGISPKVRKRLLAMALEGLTAPQIAKVLGMRPDTVRWNLRRESTLGTLRRVPKTNPAVWLAGPKATTELAKSTRGIIRGKRGVSKTWRVHAVNFRLDVRYLPDPLDDIEWHEDRPWGHCRSRSARIKIKGVGKVRLRLLGEDGPLLVYTPELWVNADELGDTVRLRFEQAKAVANHLVRKHGYELGPIEELQKPEFAHPVLAGKRGKEALRQHKPSVPLPSGGEGWVDTSPGDPEVEFTDEQYALEWASMPVQLRSLSGAVLILAERMDGIEGDTGALKRNQVEFHRLLSRLKDVAEGQQAETAGVRGHLDHMTHQLQRLGDRMERALQAKVQKDN